MPVLLLLLMLNAEAADRMVTSAMLGNEAEVRRLLDEGVPVEARDRNGDTALVMAASYRQPSIVRLLLDRGADPDLPGRSGRTALATPLILARPAASTSSPTCSTAGPIPGRATPRAAGPWTGGRPW